MLVQRGPSSATEESDSYISHGLLSVPLSNPIGCLEHQGYSTVLRKFGLITNERLYTAFEAPSSVFIQPLMKKPGDADVCQQFVLELADRERRRHAFKSSRSVPSIPCKHKRTGPP
jgi:hypothetical protein